MEFSLDRYLHHARESLKAVAKEMAALSRKLIESKDRKRIAEKTPVTAIDSRSLYEVVRLGFLDSVEGLLANPTPEVAALDVDRIRTEFPTGGDWFPFEVLVDDLLFVIDDDGALFISTENFPREALDKAQLVLHRLAGMLYSSNPQAATRS